MEPETALVPKAHYEEEEYELQVNKFAQSEQKRVVQCENVIVPPLHIITAVLPIPGGRKWEFAVYVARNWCRLAVQKDGCGVRLAFRDDNDHFGECVSRTYKDNLEYASLGSFLRPVRGTLLTTTDSGGRTAAKEA